MPTVPPVIAQRAPIGITVQAGTSYWWCACGRSAAQPFCDGSHKGTGLVPLEYKAAADGEVWFCGCKHSAAPPLCDGTHGRL